MHKLPQKSPFQIPFTLEIGKPNKLRALFFGESVPRVSKALFTTLYFSNHLVEQGDHTHAWARWLAAKGGGGVEIGL